MVVALYRHARLSAALLSIACLITVTRGFSPASSMSFRTSSLQQETHSRVSPQKFLAADDDDSENADSAPDNSEADRLYQQAEQLREQIRSMEEQLGDTRPRNYEVEPVEPDPIETGPCLKGKRVMVVGANGRLGSMVCRYLLRNHPQTQVVAQVHYVGEDSPTSRGYGRLAYEVGAEDGIGTQGPAWSGDDRTATFQFADYMKDYNLQNLRIVECELLDPVQCMTVTEGCDAVVWCATDFNGNTPRAVSGLNVAFLFRALADPDKGRVEVEGLQNMLGALKNAKQEKRIRTGKAPVNDCVNFVLVSAAPNAFEDYETPYGSFKGIKRQGENMLKEDFPSLSHTILQMGSFDDNFVEENMDVFLEEATSEPSDEIDEEKAQRRINRRDAAKAAVQALTSDGITGKTVEVWTALRAKNIFGV